MQELTVSTECIETLKLIKQFAFDNSTIELADSSAPVNFPNLSWQDVLSYTESTGRNPETIGQHPFDITIKLPPLISKVKDCSDSKDEDKDEGVGNEVEPSSEWCSAQYISREERIHKAAAMIIGYSLQTPPNTPHISELTIDNCRVAIILPADECIAASVLVSTSDSVGSIASPSEESKFEHEINLANTENANNPSAIFTEPTYEDADRCDSGIDMEDTLESIKNSLLPYEQSTQDELLKAITHYKKLSWNGNKPHLITSVKRTFDNRTLIFDVFRVDFDKAIATKVPETAL